MYPFQLFIRLLIKYQSPLKEVLFMWVLTVFQRLLFFMPYQNITVDFLFFQFKVLIL